MKEMTLQLTRHWLISAGILLGGFLSLPAQAGEAALYAPGAPKGSAFVRLYNAGNQEVGASVGNANLDEVAPLASSDFSFLPPGAYTAKVGAQSLPVTLEADRSYTLVNLPGSAPKLVEEPPFKSRQKSLLRLQNLSDRPLSLKTADGKTEVVGDVAPQSHGEREINPVKVSLALFDGATKVGDLQPLVLPRGEAVCLYVTGSGNKLSPVWVKRPEPSE
jgi:alginate O-acetyltransferase complex protein AlgF